MRLRWTIALAFIALALLQVAVVVPLALRNLSRLLTAQQEARVDQMMVAVEAEATRVRDDVRLSMDELAQSQALEEVAKDAARVPPPPHVTTAAVTLMRPRGLDVLALLDDEGRTLSSGHLPARLGEPDDPLFAVTKVPQRSVAARAVELSSASGLIEAPAIVTARAVDYGDRRVWAVGGVLLDETKARSLHRLTGARVEVHSRGRAVAVVGDAPTAPIVRTLPIGDVAELRLVFSGADLLATRGEVLRAFLALAGIGFLLALVAGIFISRRVTRPVEALTEAARSIAQGTPGVKVPAAIATSGELKELVATFNRMTDELKTATDRLVASERIAAWQEVARRLAHEIKNPLTPIRMSLETLLAASQRGAVDARFVGIFKESAHAVLEEVDRLKRIVDEFSQFARLPRPSLAPIDLSETAQQIMALYAPHDAITYDVQLEPGARINGDRDQLTQIVVNLVKNAEEAMTDGGGVVRVTTRSTATEVILEVSDTGKGIPAELKARLFEPYVTSKPQGTGLGLAIALRIAQEHEGRLEAADAVPHGALFRLTLPRLSDR